MATLLIDSPGAPAHLFPLVKPLVSACSGRDSDVRIDDVRGVVAIQFDGKRFMATALDGASLIVNGKKRAQHALADGDTLQLGKTKLHSQNVEPPPAPPEGAPGDAAKLDPAATAVQRLADFLPALA